MTHNHLKTSFAWMAATVAILLAACADNARAEPGYSWQQPHAKVLPAGDLQWAPQPFRPEKGGDARYIDFENGDDARDGRSPAAAWKHHPLDPAAIGQARNGADADTFLFKRGVTYRGALRGKLVGTPERPIRLTIDPSWGVGDAVIVGSERVTAWKLGADHDAIPDRDKVWVADLDFAPRAVWTVANDGKVTRIPLARTPNWTITDPEDVMGSWYEWEQPEWWTDKNKTTVGNTVMHLGIDSKRLAGKAEDYVGGIVWSEWGIVMGTPFASKIESYDAGKKGIGFQGFWYNDSGKIITGNRYFLEDKPNFLDAPGEFWFERKGDGGRLHLRLPGDANPNAARIEVARRINLMDFDELRHVRISGLAFRFSNVFWDLTARQFVHEDVQSAAIRLHGSGDDIQISHCRFAHVNKAIRLKAVDDADSLDRVVVCDNDVRFTDHGAIELEGSERWGKTDPPFAFFGDAKLLRNRLYEIGRRPFRSDSAHAVHIGFPQTLEVAGNILERTYGAGLFIFMGKRNETTKDVPLARGLVHHNKVVQPLLAANDWGGIETWQGGPVYVYNNISGNPGGYWNWAANRPGNARLGFAYYLDGAFKNYHFNNIAWGANNDLSSKYCNRCAFYQAVPTILNAFFNNTAYRFAEGSGWSPVGGRQLYLGNVWIDISAIVFAHGKQKEDEGAQYDHYQLDSIAYSRNIFEKTPATFGNLEGSGSGDTDLAGFRKAAEDNRLLASDIGLAAQSRVLADPAKGDFRPAPNSPALGKGVRFFVPWALSRTVGEWHFRRNNADPAAVLDEHWYMSPLVLNRDDYHSLPRHDLRGEGLTAADYEDGPLEDWCAGALRFAPGRGTVLTLPAPKTAGTEPPETADETLTHTPADWLEVATPAAFVAGQDATIDVRLKDVPAGQKLMVHLHWLKKQGWGGFDTLARSTPDATSGGTFRFTLTPGAHGELDAYSLLVALSPTGRWEENVRNVTMRVPAGKPAAPPPSSFPGPHDTENANFLVEAFFRADAGARGSVLVSCLGERGYELGLDAAGAIQFRVKADNEARVASPAAVADGRWHHVVAECDRAGDALRLHLDGRRVAEAPAALRGSARHDGDLRVGRGADPATAFSGSLEFLRIALGTLADSKTTIEELFAWEFDGPFLRDFTGRKAGPSRAAGALDAAPSGSAWCVFR
ncbi:MAG: LamG domain-containing protein [Kiritimatiellia bacterium]|jgi:hypothetical protein